MAGAGFDAAMIRDAEEGGLKERVGRVAYVWTGSENLRSKPFRAEIKVDGVGWYRGKASCILLGNVGKLFGGVEAFEDARPDDGQARAGRHDRGRAAPVGPNDRADGSRHGRADLRSLRRPKARSVKIKLDRKVRYELDGGDRTKVKSFKVKVEPAAITVCVPASRNSFGARVAGGFVANLHAHETHTRPAPNAQLRGVESMGDSRSTRAVASAESCGQRLRSVSARSRDFRAPASSPVDWSTGSSEFSRSSSRSAMAAN